MLLVEIISTNSISSAGNGIKRAIQKGKKSRYRWITLSHKKLSGSQFTTA